jgi:hypothetical protein
MNTSLRSAFAIVLVALVCGCRICQSPFDYCTAVVGPDGHPCFCDFSARMNSVYSPPPGAPPPVMGPTEARPNNQTEPRTLKQSARHRRGFPDAPPELSADEADERVARLPLPESDETPEESATR